MIPQQTFESYPVFGDNATKIKPDDAKYAAGFQQSDVLPAEWMNWAWGKNTKGITDLNEGLDSVEKEIIAVLTEYNITPAKAITNQLLQAIKKIPPKIATCTSAANASTKEIPVSDEVLKAGNIYTISMTHGNTYGDGSVTYPSLSINGGTAYAMCYSNGNYLKSGAWEDGEYITVIFTGTRFLMFANTTNKVESGNMNPVTSNAAYGILPIASVLPYAGSTAPAGFFMCDGQEVSRTTYSGLFAIIGTTYGAGDNSTTFNVPDYRESTLVGVGKNLTDTIAAHDEYTLGQFKDDQFQGHFHFPVGQKGTYIGMKPQTMATPGTVGVELLTNNNGNIYAKTPVSDDVNGTPRFGTTTHGKQKGVNYIIKAL